MDKYNFSQVCYLGDDDVTRAAVYLSGIMSDFGITYDRVDGTVSPPKDFCDKYYSLYIISDYSAMLFSQKEMEHIVNAVQNEGSGLLMIGGWESFYGRKCEYQDTPLVSVLPVEMMYQDDRYNAPAPVFLLPVREHSILHGLPWDRPSSVGGFNLFTPKEDAQTILEGAIIDFRFHGKVKMKSQESHSCDEPTESEDDQRGRVQLSDDEYMTLRPQKRVPLLVVGQYGKGRTAAFAPDLAPHWVGNFVDWGNERLSIVFDKGEIEVGCWYATFCCNLIRWTASM